MNPRYRQLIGPFIFSLLMFAAAIALGVWQVKRLHWKENLLAEIAVAQSNPPIPLPAVPRQYTKVSVTGRWDHAHAVLYGTDVRGERLGSFLVEPLLRPGLPPLIVDRGFLPDDMQKPADPTGDVTVTGYISDPDHPHWWSIKDDLAARHFYTLNPTAIAAALGTAKPAPYLLELMGDQTSYPEPAHAFPDLPNNHLSYAVTWFSMALIDLVIFILAARKTLRT